MIAGRRIYKPAELDKGSFIRGYALALAISHPERRKDWFAVAERVWAVLTVIESAGGQVVLTEGEKP